MLLDIISRSYFCVSIRTKVLLVFAWHVQTKLLSRGMLEMQSKHILNQFQYYLRINTPGVPVKLARICRQLHVGQVHMQPRLDRCQLQRLHCLLCREAQGI